MATDIVAAVEEFISLNQRFVACGLQDREHARWTTLARTLDGAIEEQALLPSARRSRRRNARARLSLPVRFLYPAVGEGRTIDLSCGGCAVEIPVGLERGGDVELTLELGRQLGVVHVAGWVCWATPLRASGRWRAGITFAGLTAREREIIAARVLEAAAPALVGAA